MRHHLDSSNIAEILSPVDGYRGTLILKGQKPKDHITENKRGVK